MVTNTRKGVFETKKRLDYKILEKTLHKRVLEESDEGYIIQAVYDYTNNKILYHVISSGSNVIELYDTLKEAAERYNKL